MIVISGHTFNRRRFLVGAAFGAALVAAPAAFAVELAQAEWPQKYEEAQGMTVARETTPTLSAATAAATETAIQTYESIVARGGWNTVPTGNELRVGMKSKAVQALRQRLDHLRRSRRQRRHERRF